MTFDLSGKRVWVAGHGGMVGSALVRRLASEECEVLVAERLHYDLRCQTATTRWLRQHEPDVIIIAAARVGGIGANLALPGRFLYDNLTIAANIIEGARCIGTEKLLFLGSSCIYPRMAPQPIKEEYLLTGPLEATNEPYAIAKIAGLKLCQAYRREYGCDFISVMPTNLYGPGDRFDPDTGHVIPSLMAKMYAAKVARRRKVTLWGTGTARREFMHVDDLADACVHVLKHYSDAEPINIGCGYDVTITEVAGLIRDVVGFKGKIVYDGTRPDGTPQKLLDCDRMNALGWEPKIPLNEGLRATYKWFRKANP